MLNNELYIGRLIWDRLRYVKDPATGKRRSRPNPVHMLTSKEVPHLRIVPQELWDAVKARQEDAARNTRPDHKAQGFWCAQRPKYLLSGLMKCGACGSSFTKYGKNRFACAAVRDRGTCSNKLTAHGQDVEEAVLYGLKTHLMQPELYEEFARSFVKEANRHRSANASAHRQLRANLKNVERKIDRLVDAIADGVDAVSVQARLKALEAERATISSEIEQQIEHVPLLHPNLAMVYRDKVAGLSAALKQDDEGKAAFEIVRSLIQEVRLVPNGNDLAIELVGDLAGILSVVDGARTANSAASKAVQIKVVAGAGFEPATFRL